MKEIKLEPDSYYPIREDLYGALERYLNHGIMPGSFMTAVLENNLMEACGVSAPIGNASSETVLVGEGHRRGIRKSVCSTNIRPV